MTYYFAKTLSGKGFDQVVAQVTDALKDEGFGIPVLFEAVDGSNARMIERSQDLRFPLKPAQALPILKELHERRRRHPQLLHQK